MGDKVLKGMVLPDAKDDLLGGFRKAFETAGTVTRASSVSQAREVLTQAQASGVGATTAQPWYFSIEHLLYIADGSKSGDGRWVLKPVNEVETSVSVFGLTNEIHVNNGEYRWIGSGSLPAKPYRRLVYATVIGWGRVTGDVNLVLRIGGEGGPKSSSAWDHEDSQSQSVTCFGYVDANVTPKIEALVQGYRARDTQSNGGTVQFVQSSELNRIMVQAFPASEL